MNEDEEFLFRQAMADVEPLQRDGRVALKKDSASDTSLKVRRDSAAAAESLSNHLAEAGIAPLESWYVLSFRRPGIQNGVFRKLKQGRYDAEARLNLRRMRVERARREVFEFLRQAEEMGLRSVWIVHGKGENSTAAERASIIKGCVNHWLRESETVQAFHSARPEHGGTGAVYVLLRASEHYKQRHRERFSGRSGAS